MNESSVWTFTLRGSSLSIRSAFTCINKAQQVHFIITLDLKMGMVRLHYVNGSGSWSEELGRGQCQPQLAWGQLATTAWRGEAHDTFWEPHLLLSVLASAATKAK